MEKTSGITPFANKVYELSRNFRIVSEHLDPYHDIDSNSIVGAIINFPAQRNLCRSFSRHVWS